VFDCRRFFLLGTEISVANDYPVLLYTPLPVLFWAAIRFGPRGICSALFVITLLAIWHAINGRGPFTDNTPADNVLSLQLFLIAMSIPMMLLDSLMNERHRAQANLRQSESQLRAVLASARDPIFSINAGGSIRFVSDSIEQCCGWKPQELIGQNIKILIAEPYQAVHDRYLDAHQRTDKSDAFGQPEDLQAMHRDGSRLSCEITLWRVASPGQDEPVFTGIIRDITERKAADEHMLIQIAAMEHASRLTMAEQMAAAMAHELNHPLGAIANFLDAGLREIKTKHPLTKAQSSPFHDAIEQAQHAGKIVGRTINFLRRGAVAPKSLQINDVIHQSVLLMTAEAGYRRVTIEEKPDDNLPQIRVDALHVQQVVCNLVRTLSKRSMLTTVPGDRLPSARHTTHRSTCL
jgi:two-component system sensor kinase FixL